VNITNPKLKKKRLFDLDTLSTDSKKKKSKKQKKKWVKLSSTKIPTIDTW